MTVLELLWVILFTWFMFLCGVFTGISMTKTKYRKLIKPTPKIKTACRSKDCSQEN